MRLPDPDRSYAVLIGASRYHDTDLPDLPAVSNNVTALALALADSDYGGFAPDHCAVVSNPDSVRAAYRQLRESANLATDTLLVYYAGHGLLGPVKQELYLALPDTDTDELEVSALPFDIVRQVFLNSNATNRILILDCCFSGRAVHDFMAAKTDAMLGQAEISGTYTLASVPGNALSLAPAGQQFTVFTGALLDLLSRGVADGLDLLSLSTIYTQLRHAMRIRGLPLPSQRGTDTVDQLALTRNPATAFVEPAPRPDEAARGISSRRSRATIIAVSATAMIAALATTIIVMVANAPDTTANSSTTPPVGPAANSTPPTRSSSSSSPPTTPSSMTSSTGDGDQGFKWVTVRVYNNSTAHGLAAKARDDFKADGWNVTEVANYSSGIIPASTAYYRPGTDEETAAKALAAQFGIQAEPRFDGIQNSAPGVIVIITNNYKG